VPPASAAPVPGDEDEPPDYAAYRLTDLRDLCRERGLQVTGGNGYAPKAELAARLAAHDAGHRALL
jgi:predicted RNase H-like nuclease (RuvC/YqgF family)